MEIKKGTAPPVNSAIFVCLYGDPGNRKTSFAITAEAPLLLDFDQRGHRAYGKEKVDRIDVTRFEDIAEAAHKYSGKYRTLIVDTAGRALDNKSREIVKMSKANPSMKAHNPFGGLSLPGYGILKSSFYDAVQDIRESKMHCVFVCHGKRSKEDDKRSWEPDVVGSSADEIYQVSDLMGLMSPVNGRTVLRCNPSESWQGKNPIGLGTLYLDKKDEPGWEVTLKDLIDRCSIKLDQVATPVEPHPIIARIKQCEDIEFATSLMKEIQGMEDGIDKDMAKAEFKAMRERNKFKYSSEKGIYQ